MLNEAWDMGILWSSFLYSYLPCLSEGGQAALYRYLHCSDTNVMRPFFFSEGVNSIHDFHGDFTDEWRGPMLHEQHRSCERPRYYSWITVLKLKLHYQN